MPALITTIITTYKRPQRLKRAIQSALNQTFSGIKVVVYDDQSNDETETIVNEIAKEDSRVSYHRNQTRLYSLKNFQLGIDQAETPFCSILSDDDILLPTFYETALKALEQFPDAHFFLGSVLDAQERGTIISANALKWPREGFYTPPEGLFQLINHYVNWTGVLFKNNAAKSIKLDPRTEALDFDYMLRLTANLPFVFSKTPCALFVHHSGSYSNNCGAKLFWPGWSITTNSLISDLPNFQNEIKSRMDRKLKNQLFRLGIKCLASKQFEETKKISLIYAEEFPSLAARILNLLFLLCSKSRIFFHLFQKAFKTFVRIKRKRLEGIASAKNSNISHARKSQPALNHHSDSER